MKTLDVFGPYTGPTGYDQVVRGFVSRLSRMGVRLSLQNFENWSGFNYFESQELKQLERSHGGASALLNFCLPPQARYTPHQFNVVYSMFEASRINHKWRQGASTMDLVIVPCQASYDAFREGGVRTTALRIAPLGIDPDMFNPDVDPMAFIDEDFAQLATRYPIRVMNMQELGPRKNIEALVYAWVAATSSGPMRTTSCLILKLSAYSQGRYHKFNETLAAVRKKLGVSKEQHAPIFVSCKLFQHDEIPAYMNAATHYISMSRGEGWDLPAMQAAAMGKVLIVPNHSSYKDWANDERVRMINTGAEVAAAAEGPLKEIYEDATWIEPSVDEAISILQSLPDSWFADREKALHFSQHIRSKYSWEKSAAALHQILSEEVWDHTPGVPKHDLADAYAQRQESPSIAQWTQNLGRPCGIANYTSLLCTELSKQYPHVLAFGGDIRAHDLMCSINSYRVENIQYEYQFADERRLSYMLQFLRERGVKSVVTMHTFNENAHMQNRAVFKHADAVVVHSEQVKKRMADEWYPVEKVKVLPMPVPPLMTAEEFDQVPKLKIDKVKPIIAFYGFLYFHKGAEKLVEAFARMKARGVDAQLLMLASKPQNSQDDVAGRVQKLIEKHGLVGGKDFIWVSDYVANEREVVATLTQADLIVLPYDHYGSYGTSAAIGSCLAAGKPVVATDVCWFSHVPENVAVRIHGDDRMAESLRMNLEVAVDPEMSAGWIEKIKEFVVENQYAKVAEKHIQFYRELTGFKFEA